MTEQQTVGHDTFDTAYATGTPPWVIDEPQPAIVELIDSGAVRGAVLDAGTGGGEHTILLTRRGYDVLGIDFSAHAVAAARANAQRRGVAANFDVADALRLDGPPRFDTVLDSALFHVFDRGDQRRYAQSLARVTRPGATVQLLALADSEHNIGPSIEADAVPAAFTEGWRVDAITDSRYRATVGEQAAQQTGLSVGAHDFPALLATITRL